MLARSTILSLRIRVSPRCPRSCLQSSSVLTSTTHNMAAATRTKTRSGRSVASSEVTSNRIRQAREKASKSEDKPPPTPKIKREAPSTPQTNRSKRIKLEDSPSDQKPPTTPSKASNASPADKAAQLSAKKLKSFSTYANKSPFPTFTHPTPAECRLAHSILARLHGERNRPEVIVAPKDTAGCGNSPSVLDALVRTILSQNTSDSNSSRAKRAMDAEYGGSDKWEGIVKGGQKRLEKAIQSGGLAVVKSKVIISLLEQVHEKYGVYSMDHLFEASDDDAMREMLSFKGVGPKTASCVLLFCLRRESFAVDTHVHRLTGLLGWRPQSASREEAHQHLDAMIPNEEKYALHVLLISHGKRCEECKAGGKNLGKCELRRAFRKGKVKGEAGEDVKEEELQSIKQEEAAA